MTPLDSTDAGPLAITPGGGEWRHGAYRLSTDPARIDFRP